MCEFNLHLGKALRNTIDIFAFLKFVLYTINTCNREVIIFLCVPTLYDN